jgi:PIN domain nuclease of toxin-antitoxin system
VTKLLLDTHVLLWWLAGDRRLSMRVRRALADPATIGLVSAASAWEIATKVRLGKLPGAEPIAADVAAVIASQGFEELAVSVRHAQRAGLFSLDHRDPFDRMLAAQSELEGVPLASNDRALDAFGVVRIW